MKKLFLTFSFLFLLVGCWNSKSNSSDTSAKSEESKTSNVDCINLDAYNKLTKLDQKVSWLQQNGKNVCEPELEDAIIKSHSISPNNYTTTSKVPFTITTKEIKDFVDMNYYNAYVSFDFDTDKEIHNIKMIPKFDTIVSSYSPPFFRTIIKKNNLSDNDIIQFKKALIKGKEKIVVVIEKDNVAYDYSNEPKSLKEHFNPL